MLRQLFVFVFALFAGNAIADAKPQINPIEEYVALEVERLELEQELFGITDNGDEIISIAAVSTYKLEEEVEIGFNTADRLPADFNAKEGMNYIDWNEIALVELEEEIDLGFDPYDYLPADFDPFSEVGEIDWSTFELYEIEEEDDFGFDTKSYLPEDFNPYAGMVDETSATMR